MKIALASSSLYALESLKALEQSKHEIVGFISMPDRPQGRSAKAQPNPFRSWLSSERAGAPSFAPSSDEELLQALTQMAPDLVVTLAYGRLVKEQALAAVKHGWLNIHFSILPRWRGAAPVQRSLLAGESESGVTVFKLDSGMDTGPIYSQSSYRYGNDECATDALAEMAKLGAVQLIEAIGMINEGVNPKPQQGQMSLAPKIAKSELRLKLNSTSAQMMCQIRAFTKQPGVWFVFQGQRVIITKAKFSGFEVKVDHLVGGKDSLFLGAIDGSIEIERVIPEGKREMSGGEFARGRDLTKACPVE